MKNKMIYFIRRTSGDGPIKIGCSIHPRVRLETCLIWSPYPLEIVATVANCTHRDENLLHWKFKASRLHGEWFEPTEGLLDVVELARREGVLPPFVGDEDRHNQIISLFFAGKTQEQIGERFGVTRQRVQQILLENGISTRAKVPA